MLAIAEGPDAVEHREPGCGPARGVLTLRSDRPGDSIRGRPAIHGVGRLAAPTPARKPLFAHSRVQRLRLRL